MATKIDADARGVAGQTFYEVSTGPKKITAAELLERSKGGKYVSCLFGFHGVPKGMTEHQFAEQVERALQVAAAALLGDTAETRFLPNAGLVVLRPDGETSGNGGWTLEHWDGATPVAGDVTAGGAPD